MHLSEFKAWFEGFTEEMKGPPSKEQWAKIKKHVKEISADYTPAPVFIRDYVYPWRRYWDGPTWYSHGSGNISLSASNDAQVQLADWSAAGKAEYAATR